MRWGAVIVVLVMLATAAACACKNGSKGGSTGNNNGPIDAGPELPPVDPKVCDESRNHVEALYRAEMPNLDGAKPEVIALEEQVVVDNVDMMLVDCRANARRFAPCLKSAVSVAQMERDCLVPLDDEGREGTQFLPKKK